MIRALILALAATALSGGSVQIGEPGEAPRVADLPIGWQMSRSERPGAVQLRIDLDRPGRRSSYSRPVRIADLPGLGAAPLSGNGPVAFRRIAEAGTLDCRGTMDDGRGSGTCVFRADAGFGDELVRRGIARPTVEQHFQLAMSGVGRSLVAALHTHGYRDVTLDHLLAAAIHNVTPDYVTALAEAGVRPGSVQSLVDLRIHGITPQFVRGMAQAGHRGLEARQLVALRIHGVTPDFARSLTDLGYRGLTPANLTAMRIHGVTPDWVRRLHASGVRPATADELVEARIMGRPRPPRRN